MRLPTVGTSYRAGSGFFITGVMQTTDKARNRWQTYEDMWVAEIAVERQWRDIAEKHGALYSLFRLKEVLQRGGNA